MCPGIALADNHTSLLSVYIPSNAGPIERNAVALFVDEVRETSDTAISLKEVKDWSPKNPSLALGPMDGLNIEQVNGLLDGVEVTHEEGFAIKSAGNTTVLTSKTGAGVLYAIDEVLDSLLYDDGRITLPEMDLEDHPDCSVRGASFSTHAYGRYVEDADELQKMKDLVRFYARNRVNTITVETTGKKWPGDLTSIVTWKYFEPLQDPTRNEIVELRRKYANELIAYAHSWGVKVILYTTEFNHEPDIYEHCPELMGVLPETWSEGRHNYIRGCICISKDIAWDYWRAKVKEALEALPEIDGLELWMAEVPAEFGICSCSECQKLTRPQWLEKWFNFTRDVIDEVRPDMPFYIKTFQSSQGSLEVERFSPLKGKFPHDTTIVTKAQFGDMAYLNDPHPLLGWIQNGEEITEFDVGGEYRGCGLGAMVCCIPEYIADRMRLYYDRGLRKFYARHAVPTWPNKEFLDINDTAFYKLTWDINTDLEAAWQEWAENRFGAEAAQGMIELLKMSDEVVNKSIYVRGACANRHYFIFPDNLDSLKYMMVDLSAQMIEGGLERIQPNEENIRIIVEEKEQAVQLCGQMKQKFEEVAPLLEEDMRVKLESILNRMEQVALVMRYASEAIWHYFAYERSFSVRDRDCMRPHILRMLNKVEEQIDTAQKLGVEKVQGETFWGLWKVVDFDRARRLIEEVRGLLNFRIGQKGDYTVTMTPITVGHPNTYHLDRKYLREVFYLPGEG